MTQEPDTFLRGSSWSVRSQSPSRVPASLPAHVRSGVHTSLSAGKRLFLDFLCPTPLQFSSHRSFVLFPKLRIGVKSYGISVSLTARSVPRCRSNRVAEKGHLRIGEEQLFHRNRNKQYWRARHVQAHQARGQQVRRCQEAEPGLQRTSPWGQALRRSILSFLRSCQEATGHRSQD